MRRLFCFFWGVLFSFVSESEGLPHLCDGFIDKHVKQAWTCSLESEDWQVLIGDKSLSRPLKIRTKESINEGSLRRILILSSKASSAYDQSSATLFHSLYEKAKHYHFTLVNYAQKCVNKKGVQVCAYADAALEKAVADRYDLVLSMGSDATSYLARHTRNLLPVVSVCAKDPRHLGLLEKSGRNTRKHIAYTSLDIDPKLQIDYLQSLFLDNLKRVVVIVDTDNVSSLKTQLEPLEWTAALDYPSLQIERVAIALQGKYKNLFEQGKLGGYLEDNLYSKIRSYSISEIPQVIPSVKKEQGQTIFLITGSTELFNHIAQIKHAAGDIPLLSVTPSFVREGNDSAFMALGVSFTRNARKAADYAYQILERETSPGDLPLGKIHSPDIAINFMQLPKGFKVPFKFYENASYIYDHQGRAVRCDGINYFEEQGGC